MRNTNLAAFSWRACNRSTISRKGHQKLVHPAVRYFTKLPRFAKPGLTNTILAPKQNKRHQSPPELSDFSGFPDTSVSKLAEQEVFLRDHACDEMRGFLFSRAVPEEEILNLLRAHLVDAPGL
jgi:hypothetical protein